MNRREFNKLFGAGVLSTALPATTIPAYQSLGKKEVGGVPVPDSALANKAAAIARECSEPHLFNHAMRTYLFGALSGMGDKLTFDHELLYIGCILHDIGLTSRYMGDLPFEIQGAEAARKFLESEGVPKEKWSVVWDGIALHAQAASEFKQPEIMLVGAGAGIDVVGGGLKDLPQKSVNEILTAYPRLKFKQAFVATCADVIRKHPRAAGSGFMRDIRERYVPEFKPRNICDAIEKAPFEE